jgi:hypothetical protein
MKDKLKKKGWRHGSSGRESLPSKYEALPEFKPYRYQKKKETQNK